MIIIFQSFSCVFESTAEQKCTREPAEALAVLGVDAGAQGRSSHRDDRLVSQPVGEAARARMGGRLLQDGWLRVRRRPLGAVQAGRLWSGGL